MTCTRKIKSIRHNCAYIPLVSPRRILPFIALGKEWIYWAQIPDACHCTPCLSPPVIGPPFSCGTGKRGDSLQDTIVVICSQKLVMGNLKIRNVLRFNGQENRLVLKVIHGRAFKRNAEKGVLWEQHKHMDANLAKFLARRCKRNPPRMLTVWR